ATLQARLIEDILDVSRIMSGKLRLAPETIEVSRLITNAVDAVRPTADAKEITLTTSFAAGLGMIVADATRIQQVIWNLLTNAVKFTQRNGAVQVKARRTASQIEIAVTDNGEGISASFLPHVFEAFRQAESPRTRVHGGLGLGLSIVRYIAEAHGGTITAESEGRGKGSTFTLTLPIRAARSGDGPAAPSQASGVRDRLTGLQIVLVEDEYESRKMIAAVLRAAGAEVVALESVDAALDSIRERLPDLVITDIAMPDADGYSLVRAVRELEEGRTLKIVALSAFPARRDEASGFTAWLSKPIDPFHLVDEIVRIAGHTAGTPNA
ncbi:MAG TPA: hybrid sensor histidine kinase/response regulator, partial [Thermoanaerobaculia bacterium]